VPLSSVDQGSAKIGKTAAVMALKLAQSQPQTGVKTKLIQPYIVVRASSLRKRSAGRRDKDTELSPVERGKHKKETRKRPL
jgi:hypothetical protein